MKSVVRLLAVAVGCLLAFAAPASAQYMYLDVNGDGVNTTADVLTSASTGVDVWLTTNANADGSPATCNVSANPLDLQSYEFFLHATGGSAVFGAWTDNVGFPTSFGDFQNAPRRLPWTLLRCGPRPGQLQARYARAQRSRRRRDPGDRPSFERQSTRVHFVRNLDLRCYGNDFDNTIKLGTDWRTSAGTYRAGAAQRGTRSS